MTAMHQQSAAASAPSDVSAPPSHAACASGDGGTLVLAAAATGALVLAGCAGGGGGGGGGDDSGPAGPPPAVLAFTAITVIASSTGDLAINGAAAPAGSRQLDLDGSAERPADPGLGGPLQAYAVAITETGAATSRADIVVEINPAQAVDLASPAVARIRHLYARTAFGPREDDLLRWANLPYARLVDALVDGAASGPSQAPPSWAGTRVIPWSEIAAYTPEQQEALNDWKSEAIQEMYAWWIREMITGPQPLAERMTIFWTNHFVTNAGDLFSPQTSWRYLTVLRANCVGNFKDLVWEICRDPAMVLFLDSDSNVKGRPNENFARELMELFTLGENLGYTEADVVEVARCFTGFGNTPEQLFRYRNNRHEEGSKQVFGLPAFNFYDAADETSGMADGRQVVDHIFTLVDGAGRNRVGLFIAGKLWDEFVGGNRDQAVIDAWAASFAAGGFAIAPLLKTILLSPSFTAATNRGSLVRSPVELHVGIRRSVRLEPENYNGLYWLMAQEDQALLNPPNVRGWIGGTTWIDTRTILGRREHLRWLGWEWYNDGDQRIPERLDALLPTLWFAGGPYDLAGAESNLPGWDPRGGRIRNLLVDHGIHLK
jgi:uncharacterized protein (DUF1800 family)